MTTRPKRDYLNKFILIPKYKYNENNLQLKNNKIFPPQKTAIKLYNRLNYLEKFLVS